jgi:hypothetical protein
MHYPLRAPEATPSRIFCIRSYRGGCHRQTGFSFFTFLPSRDWKAPQGNQGKTHRRLLAKILEKSCTLSATKINLQYIPDIIFVGPQRPPSWILCTRSGGGGCGMYMLVRLSYLPVGSGLTQGKVQQKKDFQPES